MARSLEVAEPTHSELIRLRGGAEVDHLLGHSAGGGLHIPSPSRLRASVTQGCLSVLAPSHWVPQLDAALTSPSEAPGSLVVGTGVQRPGSGPFRLQGKCLRRCDPGGKLLPRAQPRQGSHDVLCLESGQSKSGPLQPGKLPSKLAWQLGSLGSENCRNAK